ncbi:MAG: radical SAM protein [Methanomicrobiales archaeon]|nr:radical SAM protein [Methanomicrobiales archaeon]
MWAELKARLLNAGTAYITGVSADEYIARSRAGPGAGKAGSIFFSMDGRRVRLTLSDTGFVEIQHTGNGQALLRYEGEEYSGILEKPGLHCPRQAYLTITGSCIFQCRYCNVWKSPGPRRSIDEIEEMVTSVFPDIDAISLTSGVLTDIHEEERYTLEVVRRLQKFHLPIGVSIYPDPETPRRLKDAGVSEVKFNLETATDHLFSVMCPGLVRDDALTALRAAVPLFGRNHVFSNIILGLGETDEEMTACIEQLCQDGILPVIRPLTPGGDLIDLHAPLPDLIIRIARIHEEMIRRYGLDPKEALTMCPSCTGCDLIPGRDT